MLQKFDEFIRKNALFNTGDRILLGVSGGIDSMAMTKLFQQAGVSVGIAHCNFSLRGTESDADENFVTRYAFDNGIPFFSIRFDTRKYATDNGISIQMAARDLRMSWMLNIAEKEGFTVLAMAHHQDDEVESFFQNLMRGTGIAGLHGILPKTGRIIHPMMFTCRAEITRYAIEHHIPFRDDSSNFKLDYSRNKIRHGIIPELEKIKPGFAKILSTNIKHFRAVEIIYREYLVNAWTRLAEISSQGIRINKLKLKELPETETCLFEFLRPFGFNSADAARVSAALDSDPGRQFTSTSHRVVLDREYLLIGELKKPADCDKEFFIQKDELRLEDPVKLILRLRDAGNEFKINTNPNIAQFDADKLEFPLKIRKWEKGDYFIPFGMKGKKLVSDFFIDNKFSIFDKEACRILTSGEKIIWLIGHRIDDRYKISESTGSILEIEFFPTL